MKFYENRQENIVKQAPLNNKMYAYYSKWGYFQNGIWIEEKSSEVLSKLSNYKQK